MCSDRDRLDENLARRIVADVILASVSTRAIGISDASFNWRVKIKRTE